ncbi:methyl-accepting chemotaxis sensory transducer with Cache sensor [Mobilisporobacter senegalensis]|uniref:Methyl-accepting chemotaxis sensory transducer with Cache sensor n=1 Tax=Mobilisporobacter senegalensis TaxID=1329262 RepID=A0A3N1XV92_9FIRM|nr:methyl-accepting chemotaxis protein [Mobilisporobacter senegalensis]ROR30540.1 methyl-accepting chemotaxis sensory transducer with Cache sensor [Mobilisporobacter senegalensis]
MKSIKNKLILVTLILVLIPLIGSTVLGFTLSYNELKGQAIQNQTKLADSVADNVLSFVDKAYSLTEHLSVSDSITDFNPTAQSNALAGTVERHPYFDLLYVQGTDGMQTARSAGELGDRSSRWWFTKMIDDKTPFVSQSYYSLSGNKPVTSIFFPINQNGSFKGIMGADLSLDALQQIVEEKSQDGSYTYIIDGEGVVIAHPEKTQVSELYNYKTLQKTVQVMDAQGNVVLDADGNETTEVQPIEVAKEIQTITTKVLSGESGTSEYKDLKGDEVISAYESIKIPGESAPWAVITVQKQSDALSIINNMQNRNIIMIAILIPIVILITYFISSSITKPIVNLMKLMEQANQGDLTVKSNYHSKNELGKLSNSFNSMIMGMKTLIEEIQKTALEVSHSSNMLAATTEDTAKATEEVAKTIVEVATGANNQALEAEDGSKEVQRLAAEVDNMTYFIEESSTSSKQVNEANKNGMNTIMLLEEKNKENNRVTNELLNVIESLKDKANTIGQIVETITSISEQTNLLSLNAAIEAARAGDAGKGFAVVASEVKNLAESSAASSNDVKDIITSIQKDILKAQQTMEETEKVIQAQNEAVNNTKESFVSIDKGVENIVSKISNITNSLDLVIESKTRVMTMIEHVSVVSEETAVAAQEVSAATEEQNAASEQVNALAEEMNEMAKHMESAVKAFQI